MDKTNTTVTPFRYFTREDWARLRDDTPLTLDANDIDELRGLNDRVDLDEVVAIYLPLSRLLNLYVAATQSLHDASHRFLNLDGMRVPYIIGMGGSVAVGKSTTARILRRLLSRWPDHPKVELVTTDGFLLPNAKLESEGILNRKGFPESYDLPSLLRVLNDIKSGKRAVTAPVYSHLVYDVVPGETVIIGQPDILIVEGLNVLQTVRPPPDGRAVPNVSDFFDFSIYLDASQPDLRDWYIQRFLSLRDTAFRDPKSYFHRYSALTDTEARATAARIWATVNLVNLRENVLPTRQRADLILRKSGDHVIHDVWLRKL
jgi:type I pantothenate kinase